MRLIRHIALAAGTFALAGCGLTLTKADSTPPSPTTAPQAPVASTPAGATPDRTPTPSAPSTPTAGGTGGGSATASLSTVASASGTGTSGPVTRYGDKTGLLQLPVSNAAIPEAPAGLRDFARARLKTMWHDQFQSDPGCEGIAQVRIKRSTPTAAYVEASWGATTPTCPQYAGNPGWWEVWRTAGGSTWSLTLRGEGTASCSDLVAHAISRAVYPTCSNGSQKVPNPVG